MSKSIQDAGSDVVNMGNTNARQVMAPSLGQDNDYEAATSRAPILV